MKEVAKGVVGGPSMICFSCQFQTSVGLSDNNDYVQERQLDISGCDLHINRVWLGKIAAD
jgi:hypothetical protein